MLPARQLIAALVVAFLPMAWARTLHEEAPAPVAGSSSYSLEYQTYKEAASVILDRGTLRVESVEEAVEQCNTAESWASAACEVWSWCPASEQNNCELSLPGQDNATLSLTPGRLVLSYDASPNAGILMVAGPDVTFISGVRSDSKFKGLTYVTQLNGTGSSGCNSGTGDGVSTNGTGDGVSTNGTGTTFVLLPPVANDCPSTCAAQGYDSLNGGAEGNALCQVDYGGTYYGTKNAASEFCEFTDSSGNPYDWMRDSGASAYQCVCVTQPTELFTWESTTDCSTLGKAPALGSPNACRVFNAYGSQDEPYGVMTQYAMGWILSSACHFPARSWNFLGVSDGKIQVVTGTADDYKMQTLCYSPAAS